MEAGASGRDFAIKDITLTDLDDSSVPEPATGYFENAFCNL